MGLFIISEKYNKICIHCQNRSLKEVDDSIRHSGLGIPYFGLAIGEYDVLLTLVKKQKLRWFNHVLRSSGLDNSAEHSERKNRGR